MTSAIILPLEPALLKRLNKPGDEGGFNNVGKRNGFGKVLTPVFLGPWEEKDLPKAGGGEVNGGPGTLVLPLFSLCMLEPCHDDFSPCHEVGNNFRMSAGGVFLPGEATSILSMPPCVTLFQLSSVEERFMVLDDRLDLSLRSVAPGTVAATSAVLCGSPCIGTTSKIVRALQGFVRRNENSYYFGSWTNDKLFATADHRAVHTVSAVSAVSAVSTLYAYVQYKARLLCGRISK